VTKIGDLIVDFLREFEAIFKKALTRVAGAQGELIYEKSQMSKILCQGPFRLRTIQNFVAHVNESLPNLIQLVPGSLDKKRAEEDYIKFHPFVI
jgi:hypothetical protein